MNIKIDTKEKFRVISPMEVHITANMAEELSDMLADCPKKEPPHVILNMGQVEDISKETLEKLSKIADVFRSHSLSFVTCCLQPSIYQLASEMDLLTILNYAPTESEAWDILQMEEIEREWGLDEEKENL